MLALAVPCAALALRLEAKALGAAIDAGGTTWPEIMRLCFIIVCMLGVTYYLVSVFCAAASVSSACHRVLGRIHRLHASLAAHSPELQPECTRFHEHVERAGLSFEANGIAITYRLGASIMYPVITGVGVGVMALLPTLLQL